MTHHRISKGSSRNSDETRPEIIVIYEMMSFRYHSWLLPGNSYSGKLNLSVFYVATLISGSRICKIMHLVLLEKQQNKEMR